MKIMNKKIDLTGKTFGEWKVLEYCENSLWKCQCSCGKIQNVHSYQLRKGRSKSCGHDKSKNSLLQDLTGKTFGELTALEYVGKRKWLCRCSCGKVYSVNTYDLTSGHSKSCGHGTNKFKDLTGQVFGELTALEYVGKGYWKCECSCGVVKDIKGEHLRNELIRSCGHFKEELRVQKMIEKYNEVCTWSGKSRTLWQIELIRNKEDLQAACIKFNIDNDKKITPSELSNILGVTLSTCLKAIHKFELEDYIDLSRHISAAESYIANMISKYVNCIQQDKTIISPYELDIYIPDKKIAIEFNGSYWHSTLYKDTKYHQNKTIECTKNGVQLIHIFEHEWKNNKKREIIINYIKNKVCSINTNIIYARKTIIREIQSSEAKSFLEKYHIQGYIASKISVGCFYNNELIGVMTFGAPRFNHNYEYELYRLCWKTDTAVVGGIERVFKYFIQNYNPESIITYSDISKFTGNCYLKIGFKPTQQNPITEPNYVWVNTDSNEVLTRYQTQKCKLLKQGIGTEDETEDEIMSSIGYLKIYDSGNIKLEWKKGE